ncbi:MAG: serine/threonine-protein kinase [Deltaproteobacteria bacterium]|nr:serine/threonine-protein kinase [Deltaproteobacteria bacterium]
MVTPEPETPLSDERVAAYLRGELSPTDRAAVEAALDEDPQWLTVVALLARQGNATPPVSLDTEPSDPSAVQRIEREQAARLRPGARLGRYEVEGALGRGGMGMIYAARDPRLHRRVALKLLRGTDERGQARLLREARALARLSDRHVITIHDVGTVDGRVFLAMELLEGQTLRAWRAAKARHWREVLGVFVDAGRGLQAAHAANLVHRDVKPTNVMLTTDGRVVVLDFGLAHGVDDGGTDHGQSGPPPLAETDMTLTRTGQRLGTPAYMAPEQQRGEPCGPQTDQFGFCVALFESLHGRLPLVSAYPEQNAGHAPATGRIPRALHRLLARGLSANPDDRHPSMRELVDQLQGLARPRRRWAMLAVVTGLGGAGLAWSLADQPGPQPCDGSAQQLEPTWNAARAQAVGDALGRINLPWSDGVRDSVDERLRDYGDAWLTEHEAACVATRVHGVESEDTLERRMLCLDRRRRALGALVDVLAEADVEVATQAVQAVDGLPSLAGCRDVEALRAPVPLPDADHDRDRAATIFDQLGRVEALRLSKRYDDAHALALEAVTEAEALGHAPTEADARLSAGWVARDRGDFDASEAQLRAALHAAEVGRHDEAVALAWNRLSWIVGYKLARYDEGRKMSGHAEAWGQRLSRAVVHEISRLRTLGWIEHDAGNAALALERFEAALALTERLPEDDPVSPQELALVLNGLGAAALGAADLPRAADSFQRASALLEEQLGTDHPDVARVRNNLASLLRGQGRADEARRLLIHNIEVFEGTLGREHALVGQTSINLGVTELDLGLHLDAERHANRGIEVLTAAHGPDHPMVAKARTIRGDARVQLHRPLEAIVDFEAALAIERETLGPEHPSVGIIESNLGGAYYDMEQHEQAAEHQIRSLEILEAGLGADHPNVAFVLVSLGLTRRAQGRPDEALELFRRAESQADATLRPNALTRIGETLLRQGHATAALPPLEQAHLLHAELEADPGFAGDTRFALAQARWEVGQDRKSARQLAHDAIEAYEVGGDDDNIAEVRAWLRTHGDD